MGLDMGNWFFPNGTRIYTPGEGTDWDFYRTRGEMVVLMQRKGGGEDGIYHCEIPDAINVAQTIYIGLYSASTGESYIYTPSIVCVDNRECEVSGQNAGKVVLPVFCRSSQSISLWFHKFMSNSVTFSLVILHCLWCRRMRFNDYKQVLPVITGIFVPNFLDPACKRPTV